MFVDATRSGLRVAIPQGLHVEVKGGLGGGAVSVVGVVVKVVVHLHPIWKGRKGNGMRVIPVVVARLSVRGLPCTFRWCSVFSVLQAVS